MSIPTLPKITFKSEEDRQAAIKALHEEWDKQDRDEDDYHSHWISSPTIHSIYPLMIF